MNLDIQIPSLLQALKLNKKESLNEGLVNQLLASVQIHLF